MPRKTRPKKKTRPLRARTSAPRPIRARKAAKPLRILDATRRDGRPTKYVAEYAHIAGVMVRSGCTDFELAEAFGVAVSTLYLWKSRHAEFSEAIAGARAIPIERVERSLYHRAIGYTFKAAKIVVVNGQPTVVEVLEHEPPDVHAASLWLRNVDPMRWRERREVALEKAEDKRTERELTDTEIYARLAAIDEERKRLNAIEGEAVDITPSTSKELVPK